MSRAVPVHHPVRAGGIRLLGGVVLASVTVTGVAVSVASAGSPPLASASHGSEVDEDGNTVLESSAGAGDYIVQLERGADVDDVVADVESDGIEVTSSLEGPIDVFTAPLDADALAELRSRDDVVRIERERRHELTGTQDNAPWGLDRIDQVALPLDTRYTYPNSGAGVDVYVIDTGIRETHSEFTGRIKPGAAIDFGDDNGINDCDGHGTHVAGTIGGTTWGVAKAVSIIPVSVFQCGSRSATTSNILTALNWVVQSHQAGQPAVANISLSGPPEDLVDAFVNMMISDGITVVTSAGNDPNVSSCSTSFTRVPATIIVAASGSDDSRGWFSTPGECNDLFAPGVDIRSADNQSDTGSVLKTGTSMAAPHVAGAAALVLERHPTFKPSQVGAALDYNATKGVITGEGAGDPDKLLRIATEPDPPAAPTGLTAAVAPATGVGSGQVKLTWTAPPTTAAPFTDYVIERSSDGTTGWTVVDDGVSTATTSTVGGLQNGTTYWFRVSAKTYLAGPPTGPVQATPVWSPDAPLFLSTTVSRAAGVGSFDVQLTWGNALPNGSAVTDYLIEWSVDGATWTRVDDGVSTATTYTVRGLAAATNYTFRVAAVNGLGAGAWQLQQASTPATEPAAPSVTAAVAPAAGVGSGEVKLSWTAPTNNGSSITDYQVQSSLDGTTWSTVNDPVSAATGHTLTSLTGGTAYQFRVAAKNAIGTGPWSATVTATPAAEPAAPSGVTAAIAPAAGVGSGQVKLSWTAAAGNGSLITDYLVERSVDGVTWTRVDDGISTSTTSTVPGLINGTPYRFRVAAFNAVGTGPWSATLTATPVWSPDAPSGLTAAVAPAAGVGSGAVRLAWTVPANNGSAATDYLIERSPDGTTWTAVADGVSTSTTSTVPGLINGAQYWFRVAAFNAVGTGPWSAAVTATPVWSPEAPSGLSAQVAPATGVGSGEAKLSWTAAVNNGSTITDYLIERSLDGTTWTAVADGVSPSTGFTVSGLTNGNRYSFRVAAASAVGTGPWSAVVQATPGWTAAAPSGFTAQVAPATGVGSGEVKLSWTAAMNNGSAVTDYLIERSLDGTTWTAVADGVSSSTGFTVSGLTNGNRYSFRVAAVNAVGTGPWSAVVQATPVWTAAAPTGLTAAVAPATGVGSGQAKLTWTAPASNNGSPVTDYLVEQSVDGTTWTAVAGGVSLSTVYTVGGLTNGTPYSFRVAAVNAVGTGPSSAIVTATPLSQPAAVDGLTAAVAPTAGVGSGQVKLTWTAPPNNGSAITDYLIERSVDGTSWARVADGVSPATGFTVAELVNGRRYSLRVAAVNALGQGPWSAVVQATPVWTAAAPSGLTAAVAPAAGVSSGQVKLTWTAPASNNGSPITDYLIERSVDGTSWTTVVDGVSPATGFTVAELVNGRRYSLRVAAVNAVGTGPWSDVVQATPLGTPAAPALTASVAPTTGVDPGEVQLTWTTPADTGGLTIVDYLIESSIDGTTWTTIDDGMSVATAFTVAGLTNGTTYSFRVSAVNALGTGASSGVVAATPAGTPAAPRGLTAAVAPATGVGSGQVRLTWTAPSANGSTIRDYLIQWSVDGTTWTTAANGMSTARTDVVARLTNGTQYRFRVAAVNAVGQSPWSSIVSATPRWKPAAPGGLRAAVAPAPGVGSRQVKLTWNAPASTGGSAVTDYVIQRSTDGVKWTTVVDGVSTARSSVVTRLTNGTQYRFRVGARNAVGPGPWSAVVRATPRAS